MVDFAGWALPVSYPDLSHVESHLHTRKVISSAQFHLLFNSISFVESSFDSVLFFWPQMCCS